MPKDGTSSFLVTGNQQNSCVLCGLASLQASFCEHQEVEQLKKNGWESGAQEDVDLVSAGFTSGKSTWVEVCHLGSCFKTCI